MLANRGRQVIKCSTREPALINGLIQTRATNHRVSKVPFACVTLKKKKLLCVALLFCCHPSCVYSKCRSLHKRVFTPAFQLTRSGRLLCVTGVGYCKRQGKTKAFWWIKLLQVFSYNSSLSAAFFFARWLLRKGGWISNYLNNSDTWPI